MRIKNLALILVVATSLFPACKRNAISLDFTNARGEVPQLANFSFRFTRPLVNDSLLNIWDSTEYISFEPRIPGRFRWESPDQLIFSPAGPLAPATSYKAKVTSAVLRFSKFDKVDKGDDIKFHTPDLTLDNLMTSWVAPDGSSSSAQPQVDLFFNYLVKPEDLGRKLSLTIDGSKADYIFITQNADNKISLRINSIKMEDKDYDTRIVIDKGLKPEMGNNATEEAIQQRLLIPSPYSLVIQNIESEHDGTGGTIRVTTSQQVTAENLRSYIKFEPGINYVVETAETGLVITSNNFNIEKSYDLTFVKGLRGRLGGTLKEDNTQQIVFGQLAPDISFTSSKAVYLSANGTKNIEVRVTNVPKIKLIVSKVYENNLLFSQRYQYYPRETSTRTASYDDEEGYYDYDYSYDNSSDVMLGDVIYEKEIDTRTLPRSAGGRLLNLSDYEDRLPEFNGVYHIMIRSADKYWLRDSRYVSLSDIGLIAREGEDKIFVFANSIKTAEPISGVNIMAYGTNNQLLGSGATNSEGVAEINYARKEFAGFRPAMIVAKTASVCSSDLDEASVRRARIILDMSMRSSA